MQATQKCREAFLFGIASLAAGLLFLHFMRQHWIWIEVDTLSARMKSFYAFAVQSVSIISAICSIYYASFSLYKSKGNTTPGQGLMALAGAVLGSAAIGVAFFFFFKGGYNSNFLLISFAPPMVFCFGIWLCFEFGRDLPLESPPRLIGIIVTIIGVVALIIRCHILMMLGMGDSE